VTTIITQQQTRDKRSLFSIH